MLWSFLGGVLALALALAGLFKIANEWSNINASPFFLTAIFFMVFLFFAVTLIYSVIYGWKNTDRMKEEERKGWEEEMMLRRVNARKKQEREFQAVDDTKD
jgi:preprotein translocase subunit SecG